MILVTKTYQSFPFVDGESHHGDRGFEYQDRPMTFIDLVRELRINFSGGVLVDLGPRTQMARIAYTVHGTGQVEIRTLWLGSSARGAKYWKKALRAAGLL